MKEKFIFRVNGLDIAVEFDSRNRERVFLPLLRHLTNLQREKKRRIVAFLAAPPAAGKSTLCLYLEQLSRTEPDLTPVQSVGIDVFHYPQAYLDSHTIVRDGTTIPLAKIKGAPETYDVEKLRALLEHVYEDG